MSNVCSFTESIILAQSSCGRHSIVQLSCDLGINLLQDSATSSKLCPCSVLFMRTVPICSTLNETAGGLGATGNSKKVDACELFPVRYRVLIL
ncbi:hypothetical protein QQP08_004119 [Theobroma cacao]|nr:hypothetical protein QQP08_004119 [Theobroma cacao]